MIDLSKFNIPVIGRLVFCYGIYFTTTQLIALYNSANAVNAFLYL